MNWLFSHSGAPSPYSAQCPHPEEQFNLITVVCFSSSLTPRLFPSSSSAVTRHMWLALWCPIRSSYWLWLTSTVSEGHGRSCATAKLWRSSPSRLSLRLHWQVSKSDKRLNFISERQTSAGFYWVTTECFLFLCSPARALWDPPQDPAEPRTVDTRDRISDWCIQAQTQGAENSLPGWHRETVWWKMIISRPQTRTIFDSETLPVP